ncbi:hypothetical protein LCGC14_0544690 [marine sediment metagenome]|uniref:Nucleoid-associated protein n=1 Tax=marine sediment metagenome TaxID=412755 RepID=A0A0F9UD58_9ZZZZ|nr:hypothetical protein [Halomonas sp.]|tara:strand:- start:3052 stop:4194 length:1143 start_codon:yes stop_codon:yes gene_type:complete
MALMLSLSFKIIYIVYQFGDVMESVENKSNEKLNRIISSVLYHVDVERREHGKITISENDNDLEGYLSDLLVEVNEDKQKRAYQFNRETTELYQSLNSFYQNQDLFNNQAAENLAKRLLEKEIDTDNRVGHLSKTGNGHVKKGSFLQFLYREGKIISYLGVKIEHQTFLDENDLKKRIGLAIANKVYKACKATFDIDGMPIEVHVFDTNKKPSVYWWKDFLELREIRGDSLNTKTASSEVIKYLNRIKKDYPSDYTILRNATISAFKQSGTMRFDDFITNTFQNYQPESPSLKAKLVKDLPKLRELPEKKKFDSSFNLVPSEVPYKRSSIRLSKEITINIDDGIDNLEDKIWSEMTSDGKKLVVIDSPEGYERFKPKDRD